MNTRDKRLRRVQSKFDLLPVREDVLTEAFEIFHECGELPDDDRVAQAVIDKAINGDDLGKADICRIAENIRAILERTGTRKSGKTLRELLLTQAGYGEAALRDPARVACRVLAARGGDLTDPDFLADERIPEHPAVGLHLLGYPEKVAKAPYLRQAKRLFARLAELRQMTPPEDSPFWGQAVDAGMEFRQTGELPEDLLQVQIILADYELECLAGHRRGDDMKEHMELLDKVARLDGAERHAALEKLRKVVVEQYRGLL